MGLLTFTQVGLETVRAVSGLGGHLLTTVLLCPAPRPPHAPLLRRPSMWEIWMQHLWLRLDSLEVHGDMKDSQVCIEMTDQQTPQHNGVVHKCVWLHSFLHVHSCTQLFTSRHNLFTHWILLLAPYALSYLQHRFNFDFDRKCPILTCSYTAEHNDAVAVRPNLALQFILIICGNLSWISLEGAQGGASPSAACVVHTPFSLSIYSNHTSHV